MQDLLKCSGEAFFFCSFVLIQKNQKIKVALKANAFGTEKNCASCFISYGCYAPGNAFPLVLFLSLVAQPSTHKATLRYINLPAFVIPQEGSHGT